MDKQLEKRLARINKKMVDLFEDLRDYSDTTLNAAPSEGAWSVLENMQHLYLAERAALSSVQAQIDKNTVFAEAGFGDSFRAFALRTVLSSPIKFKAPYTIGKEAFISNATFWEVAKEWKTERSKLKKFLRELPESYWTKSLYKHPRGGLMTLHGMLAFYETHFNRHHKQIRRTLRQLDAVKQL